MNKKYFNKLALWSLGCILVGVGFVACEQTQEAFQDRKTRDNSADIRAYVAANNLKADSLTSGLYYVVNNTNPSAQLPQIGDEITLSFISRRLDGVIVDSSYTGYPYTYIRNPYLTGSSYRFAGVPSFEDLMTTGVEKVREGDKVTLFVPWSLRAGTTASLLAPLYIPLRYDLNIIKVRTESEQINDYFKSINVTPTEVATNGIRFIKTLVKSDSAAIKIGDVVSTIYTGRFASTGTIFDAGTINVTVVDTASTATGGSVVKGFNAGIYRMKYGEKAIMAFPSALGYGVNGKTNPNGSIAIPGYSPLVFEIEVHKQ